MAVRNSKCWVMGAAAVFAVAALAPPAQAQDFFSNFFGGFGRPRAPVVQMPYDDNFQQAQPRQRYSSGGGQAYCVRTCDGRYFPITGTDRASRGEMCKSLCPNASTEVVYGSAIDEAATENGKPYSRLPNAFKYRSEMVAGCSCNGKDSVGLAQIDPEKDPTLRKGDIVAGANGLVVADRSADRRGTVEFSPASERIKARYRQAPVLAKGKD
jgi:uncharacterized protein DUF2865